MEHKCDNTIAEVAGLATEIASGIQSIMMTLGPLARSGEYETVAHGATLAVEGCGHLKEVCEKLQTALSDFVGEKSGPKS